MGEIPYLGKKNNGENENIHYNMPSRYVLLLMQ